MALNKIRKLDENTIGVTLPKDDCRVMGLVDENGELVEEIYAHIRLGDDDDSWSLEVVDDLGA